MLRTLLLFLLLAGPAMAESLSLLRGLRAGEIVGAGDLVRGEDTYQGAISDPAEAVGKEVVRNLYPGQPIYPIDLQEQRLVQRNQLVTISFHRRGLSIVTEGRALDEGAAGDTVRVMNSGSRQTVTGTVLVDGTVSVKRMMQ